MTEVVTRTWTCDQCGRDLTDAMVQYDWHYVLSGVFTAKNTPYISYVPTHSRRMINTFAIRYVLRDGL
jgi:hypothetical protein